MDAWRAVDPSTELPNGSIPEYEVRILFYIDADTEDVMWRYAATENIPLGNLIGMMYTVTHAMQHDLRDQDYDVEGEDDEEERGDPNSN